MGGGGADPAPAGEAVGEATSVTVTTGEGVFVAVGGRVRVTVGDGSTGATRVTGADSRRSTVSVGSALCAGRTVGRAVTVAVDVADAVARGATVRVSVGAATADATADGVSPAGP